jgi:GNAT superfamily N-acetyltransferase
MSTSAFSIRSLDKIQEHEFDALSDVLIDCVAGGASVSFMDPMTQSKAQSFWRSTAEHAAQGGRVILVAEDASRQIVGTVTVIFDLPENQPHRGDVAKMLVHRHARRRGVAAALLRAAEQAAVKAGKSLLVLDTVTGGDAERLYEREGWTRCGVIPNYALFPSGGYCATTIFYKQVASLP